MEQYLRHYINFKQNNWIDLLPLAQFAYNNHQHSTTRISPFYANYGKHPNWDPDNNITTLTSEAATTKINKIVKLHEELSKRVNQGGKGTAEQKKYKEPTFERGDKVYILTKNLKSKQPSSKLDHVRIGPFKVEKQTSEVNYRLKLPAKAQIHPNFHVSLLEPAPKNAPVQTEWNIKEEKEYDAEKILDSRKINGKD